jgi:hypothetical protein
MRGGVCTVRGALSGQYTLNIYTLGLHTADKNPVTDTAQFWQESVHTQTIHKYSAVDAIVPQRHTDTAQ